ncbi:PH domain-containing protein [Paenibacillus faecalis]|uniref:PH domain-containing protein n=1 Tax=Paenibacillus faecalis TaxID=2079532 RepID=UPI000D10975D|nr:PH domain-containing protein [Paenibacillus faecalis]
MNEPVEKRLHKLYILFPLVSSIKSMIPVIILFGIKIINGESLQDHIRFWVVLGITALILLLIIYGFFQWRRFKYVLEDNKIVIRRGVFFREELSIYTGRIHSMNMEQPLLQRILGLTQVKIDTPGKSNDGGKLPAVSSAEAERLQRWLRERTAAGSALRRSDDVHVEGLPHSDDIITSDKALLNNMQADGASDDIIHAEPVHQPTVIDRHTAAPDRCEMSEASSSSHSVHETEAAPEERTVLLQLSTKQLLIAALTSLNISLAIAFVAGVISFADDILPENLYTTIYEEAGHFLPGGWITLIAVGIILAWLLSAVLYTIKYAGFTVERVGKQIAITCGLLERKQMFFSPQRVQAVSVKEGVLRQPFGYAEVKLHVLTSESEKNLILHPMIPIKDIAKLLEKIVPQYSVNPVDIVPPRRAIWLYLRYEILITAAACAGLIWYFKEAGLWSLLLFPLTILLAIVTFKDTGMAIRGKQLTIRSRLIARTTKYIRRPQIISLKVFGSRWQRKRNLLSFEVNLMTGLYDGKIYSLDQSAVKEVWQWFRYSKDTSKSDTFDTSENSNTKDEGTPLMTTESKRDNCEPHIG